MNGLIRCAECGKLVARGSEEMVFADGRFYCAECAREVLFECPNCGEMHRVDSSELVRTSDGDFLWCEDCVSANAFRCERCDEYYASDDFASSDVDGETWCEDCTDNYACYCEDCGTYHDEDNGCYVESVDRFVCDDCLRENYHRCDCCEEWYPIDSLTRTQGDGLVCESCRDWNYRYCDRCDEWVHEDEYDDDADMCMECLRNLGSGDERPLYPNAVRLNYHSYDRPSLRWFGECRPSWNGVMRGMGVEVECDAPSRGMELPMQATLNDICELMGDRVFFEYDCSLSNAIGHGFEMITQPHTIDAFYEMPWKETFAKIMEHGYSAHDAGTCGLHVHFSREIFGADTETQDDNIAKLIQFFEIYYDDIVKVSRRTLDEYGRVYYAQKCGKVSKTAVKKYAESKRSDHYSAVNIRNSHTVEIRIMRGTLNYSSFMACIDFLITVVKNSCRIGWSDTTDDIEWLRGLKPETIEYVTNRGAFTDAIRELSR